MIKNALLATLLYSLTLFSLPALAQDEPQTDSGAEATEKEIRRERIQELRQLIREDREVRRQEIQQRLENLTEDERAALQERRQMQRQNQAQRSQRPRRQQNRCECSESDNSAVEDS